MNRHLVAGFSLSCASLMALLSASSTRAQEHPAPMVTGLDVPLYPPLARTANIEGVVHVKVTTDGKGAIDAHAEDGQKLLADAAQLNARTWRFAPTIWVGFSR